MCSPALLLAGCAADGSDNFFTTGALGTSETALRRAKVDPACVALASRIEGLRKEGIADKIEKAAAKKYKMTHADLAKADQLTKANAEFQARCSTIMPRPSRRSVIDSATVAAAPPPAAKAKSSAEDALGAPGSSRTSTLAAQVGVLRCKCVAAAGCARSAAGEFFAVRPAPAQTRGCRPSRLVLLQSCHTTVPQRLKTLQHCVS